MKDVEGQEHVILSVQVLVTSQGQELVLIAGLDMNLVRLLIRCIAKQ